MLSWKTKKIVLGLVLASTLTYSPAYGASIKIAVAANFAATLNSMLAPFQNAYPGETYSYVSDSTTNIKNAIISAGNSTTYDLFLSADQAAPNAIAAVSNLAVGSPFLYAVGSLMLYSGPVNKVNISAGLPSTLNTNLVIADPTKAPYGKAASQVLASSPWNITTVPSGFVFTRPNIVTTYQAIQTGTYAYGFVAKSAVCTQQPGGAEQYPAGTYHHEYLYNDTAHPYDRITQYAVKINRTARTAAQTQVLTDFVNFLTGVGSSAGRAKILFYCYKLS